MNNNEIKEKTITCPWWFCFTFDNFTRPWYQDPYKVLSGLIIPGYKVLDVGPGRGYFTLPLASMVGEEGIVYALDIQKKMLEILKSKTEKKGHSNVIAHLYDGNKFCLNESFDFVNIFWMFHEIRNKENFLNELKAVCKPGCKILFVEPYVHVAKKAFNKSLQLFTNNGFKVLEIIKINFSRACLLEVIKD